MLMDRGFEGIEVTQTVENPIIASPIGFRPILVGGFPRWEVGGGTVVGAPRDLYGHRQNY